MTISNDEATLLSRDVRMQRKPRTQMFVMATLYADAGSAPVKIRDLSSGGALIEGGILPHPGSRIRLVRGALAISAQIVWSTGIRAGLRFDAHVVVADWLPNARPPSPQSAVEAIVHEFKTASAPRRTGFTEPGMRRVDAKEILRANALLKALTEDLADDINVIARHGAKLQTLDLIVQLLGKLETQVQDKNPKPRPFEKRNAPQEVANKDLSSRYL